MLPALRVTAIRRMLVIFLMAISTVVAVERAQAVINGIQHELGIAHSDPVLELVAAGDGHDGHDGLRPVQHDDDGAPDSDDGERGPAPHHHHAEGPQVADLSTPTLVSVALTRSEAVFAQRDGGSSRSLVFGLERPPKTQSDNRA